MKEWFPVRTARDVVRAVVSEVTATDRSPNLAALSILLGLVEAQLTSPHNLVIRDDDPSLMRLGGRTAVTATKNNNNNNRSNNNVGEGKQEDEEKFTDANNSLTTHATSTGVKDSPPLTLDANDNEMPQSVKNNNKQDVTSLILTTENEDDLDLPDSLSIKEEEELLDFILPHPISYSRVKVLLEQFKSLVKGSIDLSTCSDVHLEETVSRVADVIWSFLSPFTASSSTSGTSHHHTGGTTKEEGGRGSPLLTSESASPSSLTGSGSAHVQFLTSFLLERRLDSFGLTFAVLSSLQVLFPRTFSKNFFLTLSEDHSWISVKDERDSTTSTTSSSSTESELRSLGRVEVTWHGKNDKRSLNLRDNLGGKGGVPSVGAYPDNWLYLRGHPVVCTRIEQAVAALISSLNPSLSANSDSLPLAIIQRLLLSCFHEKAWLQKYPMAVGNLADVLELTCLPSKSMESRKEFIVKLYYEAIASAVTHYDNHHIYPYLYLAGFWFRAQKWDDALFAWKRASRVLSKYNYNPKEDEEAYKEFQEIASDLIPYALNQLANSPKGLNGQHYRDLIEFYDGLCAWEESSRWPVLHIVWSKSFISCLHKFPPEVRTTVKIVVEDTLTDIAAAGGADGISDFSSSFDDGRRLSNRRRRRPTGGSTGSANPTSGVTRHRKTRDEIQDLVQRCSEDPEFLLNEQNLIDMDKERDEDHNTVTPPPPPTTTNTEPLSGKEALTEPNEAESPDSHLEVIRVMSTKMSELKNILVKPEGKLNASAIQLQITAQSSLFTVTKAPISRGHNNPVAAAAAAAAASSTHSPSSSSSSISPNEGLRGRTSSASEAKRLRTK